MPYDKLILKQILLQDECRTLDVNGKILSPSNPVYRLIADRMAVRGSHIKPRHVYTIINEDRNGLKTLIAMTHNITPEVKSDISNNVIDDVSNVDSSDNLSESTVFSKKVKLILSPQKWLEICPKKRISSGRVYWKFQEGWADIIAERICQQHESIDCIFSFKNNLVIPSATAKCFAKFCGYCTQCNAKITGLLQKSPMNDVDVTFKCHIENIQPHMHTGRKKRQLRGKRREKIANQLIEQRKCAITFQREETRRLKKFEGKNVAIVPNIATLRKAKEQQLLKLHRLEFVNPPLNLLHQSKYGKYAGCIHNISLMKFYCIYWSPEQQQIYTSRCKKNRNAVLTIDATGGITTRTSKSDPHVFLYQCMLVTNEDSVPVFQMVSADQRSLIIAHFLRVILTKNVPRPSIVVCDFGRALINAVAEVFGKCYDLRDYLQTCYNAFVQGTSTVPAACIKLDVGHFIAKISRWKCFDKKIIAARRFYIRCIAQAYQMEDFDKLKDFIESVLVVALSETIGNMNDGTPVPADICIQSLNNIIQGIVVTENEDNIQKFNDIEENSDAEDDTVDSDWQIWINKIYSNAENISTKSNTGNIINGCYNPEFAYCLKKRLLPYLPLWTGIMRRFFKESSVIATSASVESEFADLKHRAFNIKLPMRIDKFVFQHLDHLDGKIKLASHESDLPANNETYLKSRMITQEDESKSIEIHNFLESENDLTTDALKTSDIESERNLETGTFYKDRNISQTNDKSPINSNKHTQSINNSNNNVSLLTNNDDSEEKSKSDLDSYSTDIHSSTITDCNVWNTCENWRGKAESKCNKINESPVKKRAKPSYLDKCPEWEFIKNIKVSKQPTFKNGLFCDPVILGQIKLNVRNTCAFDALFQVVMNAIATNQTYREIIDNSSNQTVQLAINILTNKRKLIAHDYRNRAQILSGIKLFKIESFTRTIKRLDTECNVVHLTQYLFSDLPSYRTKVVCQCGYNFDRQNITLGINVNIILSQGFNMMQQAIDDGHKTKRTCQKCSILIEDKNEYGSQVIIDTTVLTDDGYKIPNKVLYHTLESIAQTVIINDRIYTLAGAVGWKPGHYIGYAKSGLYWHEYDDLKPTCESINPSKKIQPHLLFYGFSGTKQ